MNLYTQDIYYAVSGSSIDTQSDGEKEKCERDARYHDQGFFGGRKRRKTDRVLAG